MEMWRKSSAIAVWLQWTVITGVCLGTALYLFFGASYNSNYFLLLGVAAWVLMGFFQWSVVVWKYFKDSTYWTLATVVGPVLSIVIFAGFGFITDMIPQLKNWRNHLTPDSLNILLILACGILGCSVGAAQLLISQLQTRGAIGWLLANGLAFALAVWAAFVIGWILEGPPRAVRDAGFPSPPNME